MLKNPGFTGVAVATLARCIEANTAIFGALDQIALKSLPFPGSGIGRSASFGDRSNR